MVNKSFEETVKEFNSNILNGLSSEEAKMRLEKIGENKLISKKKESLFILFLSQLNDVMIYILILASIISGIMGEISDSIIIIIVILINAIIGVVQEYKAEKALESFKKAKHPKGYCKKRWYYFRNFFKRSCSWRYYNYRCW